MRTVSRLRVDFLDWYDEQPELIRDIIDQSAHFFGFGLGAALVGGLARIGLGPVASGAIGAACGIIAAGVYELVQNVGDDDNDYADLAVDITFEVLGPLFAGTLIGVLT